MYTYLHMILIPYSFWVNIKKNPWWLDGKESASQSTRLRFESSVGRSPEEGNGYPLQYSCLGNPMDRGAWRATVNRLQKSEHDLATKTTTKGESLDKALLRTAWRPNQSIPKEISPGCSLEGRMLKLKLQYFGHLMRRADLLKRP